VFAAIVAFTVLLTAAVIFGAVFLKNWAFLWALPIILGIGVPASIILFILWRKSEKY
jgi:fatty acid desaturase